MISASKLNFGYRFWLFQEIFQNHPVHHTVRQLIPHARQVKRLSKIPRRTCTPRIRHKHPLTLRKPPHPRHKTFQTTFHHLPTMRSQLRAWSTPAIRKLLVLVLLQRVD